MTEREIELKGAYFKNIYCSSVYFPRDSIRIEVYSFDEALEVLTTLWVHGEQYLNNNEKLEEVEFLRYIQPLGEYEELHTIEFNHHNYILYIKETKNEKESIQERES